jgi:putative tricarboxylic transport membrane protein
MEGITGNAPMEPTIRVRPVELAAPLFVAAVGGILAWGASRFPVDKGYSILGPQVFPYAVALFLLVLGASLGYQALTGGSRSVAEPAAPSAAARMGAAWVTGGLVAMSVLIVHLGFVLSAALLFALSARGFGSRHPLRDVAIGVALTLPVYWIFTSGLGVSLPALVNAWI